MSVSFLIGSFGDLPFEKSQNLTTHPLGLFHGRMNEQNAWYGAWGECDFDARVKEAADCASRGGKLYTKRGCHCSAIRDGRGDFAAQLAMRVSLSDWFALGAKIRGSCPPTIQGPSSGRGGNVHGLRKPIGAGGGDSLVGHVGDGSQCQEVTMI